VVLFLLESDAACTCLNGHSAGKVQCWFVMIYYRGLKFPQRAVVLLLLEGDAAYTNLNGHSAGKSAVLVLERCYKAICDGEQVF